MRVFITGATGLVGSAVAAELARRGDTPVCLTRSATRARVTLPESMEVVEGDPMYPGPWGRAIDGCDAVIHLAGESIFGKRWSPAQKQLLRDSRVESTRHVVAAIGQAGHKPSVLVNASAIGYYGDVPEGELTEEAKAGDDVLAEICAAWEQAAAPVSQYGVRLVMARIGVVLALEGGAIQQMLPPFRMGVGGPVAGGQQWFSWIHRDDVVGALLALVDKPDVSGPVNVTAPAPVRNAEFSRLLGAVLHRPAFMPMPGFALKLMMGESAYVISTGQKVLPKVLTSCGYTFKYPTAESALRALLKG